MDQLAEVKKLTYYTDACGQVPNHKFYNGFGMYIYLLNLYGEEQYHYLNKNANKYPEIWNSTNLLQNENPSKHQSKL